MRTNIDIDDDLLAEAFTFSTAVSRKELVREALAVYVKTRREELGRLTYAERLPRVRARTARLSGAAGVHDMVRKDRDTRRTHTSTS